MTSNESTEITLGLCDNCSNYVPFIRLNRYKEMRVFKCLSCAHEYKQLVNGKIKFLRIDEILDKI